MMKRYASILLVVLAACSDSGERYQIFTSEDGTMLRLDKQTGEIVEVHDGRMFAVKTVEEIEAETKAKEADEAAAAAEREDKLKPKVFRDAFPSIGTAIFLVQMKYANGSIHYRAIAAPGPPEPTRGTAFSMVFRGEDEYEITTIRLEPSDAHTRDVDMRPETTLEKALVWEGTHPLKSDDYASIQSMTLLSSFGSLPEEKAKALQKDPGYRLFYAHSIDDRRSTEDPLKTWDTIDDVYVSEYVANLFIEYEKRREKRLSEYLKSVREEANKAGEDEKADSD